MQAAKKKRTIGKFMAVVMFILLLAGCASPSPSITKDSAATQSPEAKETEVKATEVKETEAPKAPVKLSIYMSNSFAEPGVQNDPVAKEIEKRTGVTLDIINPDENKLKLMLAGGDLPDILIVPQTYMKQLIEGNNIIPLDELMKTYGKDIGQTSPVRLEFSKKYMSNDSGKLYFLPIQAGPGSIPYDYQIGFFTRWDYYKEMGYPELKNTDDYLNLLAAMQKKHPTTEDGKKVYGLSAWTDWGLWPFMVQFTLNSGYYSQQANYVSDIDNNAINMLTDGSSPFWSSMQFFNKGNQMGLLDPEAFTQKYENFAQKEKNMQILSLPASWDATSVNKEFIDKKQPDKGFQMMVGAFPYLYKEGYSPIGWNGELFAISKSNKNPEKAMELINFLNSYEGSRLISSGIEGVHWDLNGGKPEMKDAVIKEFSGNSKFTDETGIKKYTHIQGLSDGTINPVDGGQINLFATEKVFMTQLTQLDKDYSDHYGVAYPGIYKEQQASEGKYKMASYDLTAANALPSASDDIKRVDAKLNDYITKIIPKIILSKNDQDFEARKKEVLAELKKLGSDESDAFWSKAWKDAKVVADSLSK